MYARHCLGLLDELRAVSTFGGTCDEVSVAKTELRSERVSAPVLRHLPAEPRADRAPHRLGLHGQGGH